MRKGTTVDFDNKRLLSIKEAANYIGLGYTKARVCLEDMGAKRKFGSRALYDKKVIDAALEKLQG